MYLACFGASRVRAYWGLQLLGWSFVNGILFAFYWPYVQAGNRFLHFSLDMMLAFASTFALHPVGKRLWKTRHPKMLSGAVFVGLGLLCGVGVEATTELIAHDRWGPSEGIALRTLFTESVDYSLLLGAWCMFYLGSKSFLQAREEDILVRDAQLLAKEAQLRALRSQLQPHFLFNALNAASSLVVAGCRYEAELMLTQLNELLYAMLDSEGGHLTDLATELAFAKKYLAIQHIRFGSLLIVDMDLQGVVLEELMVPRWILLPLFENAIQHGLSSGQSDTPLRLTLACHGDTLTVSLENVTSTAFINHPNSGFGIGLQNTRILLRTLYGNSASLYTNKTNGHFVARIEFPVMLRKESQARPGRV